MSFKTIKPEEIAGNPFEMIGKQWFLITVAKGGKINTMTASFGNLGILWAKPVTFSYIRPTRYTYEFIEDADFYTLSFFPEEYRKSLVHLGRNSGRDSDKISEVELTPREFGEAYAFEEASLVMVCKKIYTHELDPTRFLDEDIEKNYPLKDYHTIYVGEITKVFEKVDTE